MRSLLIVSCASVCAMAQPGVVGVPALGYAPDARTNQIRPIRGVPGASLLGEPLDGAFRPTRTVISPRQDSALAISSDDRQVYLVPFSGEAARALPGAMAAPDTIAFSPSGRSAILWGSGIQVLRGVSSNPEVTEVSPGAMGAPAAVAIS